VDGPPWRAPLTFRMVSVTFAPVSVGAQSGTVTVTDNASGSPQTVNLTGMSN